MIAVNHFLVGGGADEQVDGSPASMLAEIDGLKPAKLTADFDHYV